jgi:flagellar motor switch protein FliN
MADEVKNLDVPELQDSGKPAAGGSKDINFILDIPLEVTVVIGRTKILVQELLQLGQGSVVALEKLAGEPMEVYVNDRLIGRGEVVVVNERFGIRLTDIISPAERVRQLK